MELIFRNKQQDLMFFKYMKIERLPGTLNRSRKSVLNGNMKNMTRKCASQLLQEFEIKPTEIKSALQK